MVSCVDRGLDLEKEGEGEGERDVIIELKQLETG